MLDDDQTNVLAETFRLMGAPNRLRILLACLSEPHSVGDIASPSKLSPSLVSHHLRLLRAARILRPQRKGKQVFYVAADQHVRSVLEDMAAHVQEPAASRQVA